MIVIPLRFPQKINALSTLLNRLPNDHPKKSLIKNELINEKSGFNGEKAFCYYLDLIYSEQIYIFHRVKLRTGKNNFQMDVIIVTTKFILIIEVKNFSGTLIFDDKLKQLIRIRNDDKSEEGFLDPVVQVEQQKYFLSQWLKERGVSNVPIYTLVVIANPSTIIKFTSNSSEYIGKVIHISSFPQLFKHLVIKYSSLPNKETVNLVNEIIANNQEDKLNIMQKYKILDDEIIKGIQCEQCLTFKMIRRNGLWICPYCKLKSNQSHLFALRDYYYLYGKTVTNKKFRNFGLIKSDAVCRYVLNNECINKAGDNKSRTYLLEENIFCYSDI